MLITNVTKRRILYFILAFFFSGVLHVVLYHMDFTFASTQIFFCILTVLWAISVLKRIIDVRLRSLMLWLSGFLLMLFILQIARYEVLSFDPTIQRYLWYAMYIPMTAEPILFFFLAVYIHRPQEKPLPRLSILLIIIGALLTLGYLTNDFHFLAVSFPTGILDDNGQELNGPIYYMINIFIYGLYIVSFILLQKKNYQYITWKYRWLILVPFLIGLLYFVLYPFNLGRRLFRVRMWQLGEVLAFCVIATLEACIQTGMIPANRGYELLFSAATLPAAILDAQGSLVYRTAAAQTPFSEDENTKLVSHPIRGGTVEYTVDLKPFQELNKQIAEATHEIETRNAYIAEENRIKQERAELETRNRLYERISDIVKPQLGEIEKLLNAPEGCGEKELARIAVLKAYIKRRSNMELLAAAGTLTVLELASAITEFLDYIRLSGINTATSSIGVKSYPAAIITAAYEQIEEIIEKSLETLSDMIITVRSDQENLVVRMMLKAENFSYETNGSLPAVQGFSRRISITKDNQDMIIVLAFTEGGGWK